MFFKRIISKIFQAMGQTATCLKSKFKPNHQSHILWILKGQETTHHPNPKQPIKFQYKIHKKKPNKETIKTLNNNMHFLQFVGKNRKRKKKKSRNLEGCRIVKTQNNTRARSEPNLINVNYRECRRRKSFRASGDEWDEDGEFGYRIQDVDEFLSKGTLDKPANIPVVLAFPSVLYQTQLGQDGNCLDSKITLPLGMVVNAIFKKAEWLYVQTPHAEEGYITYGACLPLGIIPPRDDESPTPCWEKSSDVFPRPALSTCDERSVDNLYLRAVERTSDFAYRATLLVVVGDYQAEQEKNALSVNKGEVLAMLSCDMDGWFWVRNQEGQEGFVPAVVVEKNCI